MVEIAASPLATEDQIEIERRTLALAARADVRAICERIGDYWRNAVAASPEQLARFEAEYARAVQCGLMTAANHDPLYPRIHAFGRSAHELDGTGVASTRFGHPNPDYIYRFMIIDEESRYEVSGRFPEGAAGPIALEISLLTRGEVYLKNISLHELEVLSDGSFTLHIDALPADGRANHLSSAGGGYQLLVRDIIADAWRQRPVQLGVRRLGPPPSRPELGLDAMAQGVEAHLRKQADDMIAAARDLAGKPANEFVTPKVHTEAAFPVGQAYSAGRFLIADDEALVFIVERGIAAFASVTVSNFWGGVGESVRRPVSLGTTMARSNPDGRFVFILSHGDPGVHNWVNPDGLHEGAVLVRWVGLGPDWGDRPPPALEVFRVKLDALAEHLPDGTPRINAAARALQIEDRARAYGALLG